MLGNENTKGTLSSFLTGDLIALEGHCCCCLSSWRGWWAGEAVCIPRGPQSLQSATVGEQPLSPKLTGTKWFGYNGYPVQF